MNGDADGAGGSAEDLVGAAVTADPLADSGPDGRLHASSGALALTTAESDALDRGGMDAVESTETGGGIDIDPDADTDADDVSASDADGAGTDAVELEPGRDTVAGAAVTVAARTSTKDTNEYIERAMTLWFWK